MPRIESDFLGEVEVPDNVYYGIFTVRASSTFKLCSQKVNMKLIRSVALIKKSAAAANMQLGALETGHGKQIMQGFLFAVSLFLGDGGIAGCGLCDSFCGIVHTVGHGLVSS